MRIWDIPVQFLCGRHLMGEHRELHGIWNILGRIAKGERNVGYRNHPEVQRWIGRERMLYNRHRDEMKEMMRRSGKNHRSELYVDIDRVVRMKTPPPYQTHSITPIDEQIRNLKHKRRVGGGKCMCDIDGMERYFGITVT